MPLLTLIAIMALPFVEVWVMILVGQQIGAAAAIAVLFAASVAGLLVLRQAGTRAHRDVDAAMRAGTLPRLGLLDTLMIMVGGILLAVPGFVTAAVGTLLVLPLTRPALRWAFTTWARRRMARMTTRDATADADYVTVGGVVGDAGSRESREPRARIVRGRVIRDGDAE